jgi:hypothetical protein
LLDNKILKSSCDNLEAALKKDGKSDIDANELYMELNFIQDFMPKENMGTIEILKFLKRHDSFPNTSILYRILLTIQVFQTQVGIKFPYTSIDMILFQTQVLHLQNKAYDLCINLIICMFLIHCNVCCIAIYSIISINIGPILAFGTGPQILSVGASAKRSRSMACSKAGGGGMLQVKRSRSTVCSGVGGSDVLRVKWSRSTACSRAGGGNVLRAKRSRSRAHSVGGGVLRVLAASKTSSARVVKIC